jgi:ADP-ribosylglycohydrolase
VLRLYQEPSMPSITLSVSEFRDKVFACWLGKNIGGTLGAPYEGRLYVNDLTFYGQSLTEAAPNDDLDFQLVWLKMLEDRGLDPTLTDFADYWQSHLTAYPWNEYGFCQRNLSRGLRPPISGAFENYYVDEMGSPIRSEIWACLAPADPQRAAELAWRDSALDHTGGDGMFGEMFWAAVESAAFVITDPLTLIRIGLAMIPAASNISRVIREAVHCHAAGRRWAEARERILKWFGRNQPCNAVPNHGFIILGWLYGRDFGDCLCKAVNCGFDTDCTGATLGSVLGILGGTAGIPDEWRKPVGERIVLHKFTRPDGLPASIGELTDRTVAQAHRFSGNVAGEEASVRFGKTAKAPKDVLSLFLRNDVARAARARDAAAAHQAVGDDVIVLHYNGDPVFLPGVARRIEVGISKRPGFREEPRKDVSLDAPRDWKVEPLDCGPECSATACFHVTPPAAFSPARLTVRVGSASADFLVLSPTDSPGFPAGDNVPRCPSCGARQEACICVAGALRG